MRSLRNPQGPERCGGPQQWVWPPAPHGGLSQEPAQEQALWGSGRGPGRAWKLSGGLGLRGPAECGRPLGGPLGGPLGLLAGALVGPQLPQALPGDLGAPFSQNRRPPVTSLCSPLCYSERSPEGWR